MGKLNINNVDKLFAYILLGSVVVYFLQGTLYPNGSTISTLALLTWLIIDCLYLVKYVTQNRLLSFEKIIILFWIVNTIYWLISEKQVVNEWYEPMSTFNNFKSICCTFLTYFPFRYLIKSNVIDDRILTAWAVSLFVVFILSFYSTMRLAMYLTDRDAVTNNMGYRFVSLFPLLGLLKKRKYTYLFMGMALYFIIMSSKRGAILCAILAFILLFVYSMREVPKKKKLSYSLLIIGIFSVMFIFLYNVFLSNEYLIGRLTKMSEGEDLSGDARINQVDAILNYVSEGSLFHMFFGYGFDKSVMMAGNYAHNDWAELLANLGIFGCVMYVAFFVKLIQLYIRHKRLYLPMQKFMMLSVIGMWLLMSMFSMGYIAIRTFLFMIVVAYIISDVEKKKKLC